MAQTTHLPRKIAAHVISPQFHPRGPDPNPMVIYLPFPLDSLWLFLTALVVQESFLLSLVFSDLTIVRAGVASLGFPLESAQHLETEP